VQHENRRHVFDVFKSYRVLHRKQRDHGFSVDAELVEGLEVGLDASPARRIGTGNGESYGLDCKGCATRTGKASAQA
jgi:hypothetical protein